MTAKLKFWKQDGWIKRKFRLQKEIISEIFLNKELFKSSFGRFFSTLAHEMSHVFGEDGQREFSDVLTHLLEQAVLKNKVIGQYSKKWREL